MFDSLWGWFYGCLWFTGWCRSADCFVWVVSLCWCAVASGLLLVFSGVSVRAYGWMVGFGLLVSGGLVCLVVITCCGDLLLLVSILWVMGVWRAWLCSCWC